MLTNPQILQYRENGFLHIQGLLPADTVTRIRDEITRLSADPPPQLSPNYESSTGIAPCLATLRKMRNIGRASETIFTVSTTPPVTTVAKDILGKKIGFYGDQVLFKQPRVGSAKPLHQDAAYFRTTPPDGVITFWCALDDADEENGCMNYVPGSHKLGLVRHTQWVGTPHLVADESSQLISVPAQKGDCIVHNSLTLHATAPNLSSRARWAILFHYVHGDAHFPPESTQAARIIPIPS